MPQPVSLISIIASSPRRDTAAHTLPPGRLYFTPFSTRLKMARYTSTSLPVIHRSSPLWESVTPLFSASGDRSASTSSIMGASWILSVRGTVFSSLMSSSVRTILDSRSVCSRIMAMVSAVSGQLSPWSVDMYRSSRACISASGVRSSWAALPTNCC